MPKTIDYYMTPTSPWAYFGHERFAALAALHGAHINLKPVDYGRIFPTTGGLPLAKRAPARVAYRTVELNRWQAFLGIPLNPAPRYFPVSGDPSGLLVIAADQRDLGAMHLAAALFRACWVQERDIADPDTLVQIANEEGRKGAELLAASQLPETKALYDQYTQEAIEIGVFGAPVYAYRGELFWGQDRLEFLDRALAKP
jgi:2-hydroxychromene-2-carboxylate isomerase